MNEARRVLDPLRGRAKQLERKLLLMVKERQRRKESLANSKKVLPSFCKSFMDDEPTAKLISLLKYNIAELEQSVDELKQKVIPPVTSSSFHLEKNGYKQNKGNGTVDVVNVIQDEDVANIKEIEEEEGEDTVDGITIYPRSLEEDHSTVSESLPE